MQSIIDQARLAQDVRQRGGRILELPAVAAQRILLPECVHVRRIRSTESRGNAVRGGLRPKAQKAQRARRGEVL